MVGTINQQLPSFWSAGITTEAEEDWKQRKKDWLWKEFFREPSKWWDNRSSKPSPRSPDFKHRLTKEPLWLDSRDTPSWVLEELRSRQFSGDPCHVAAFSRSQIDVFLASIRACSRNKDLVRGIRIHNDVAKIGLLEFCVDALVIMYAKCGQLQNAQELFDAHQSSNVVTWTALIAGYARHGHGQSALDCFDQMQHAGILPDAVTYSCILKACALTGAVDKGQQTHDEIARQGLLQNDTVLGGALVDMYAKGGAVSKAQQVLDGLPCRDVVSWNALIAGYVQQGQAEQALDCFEKIQHEGIIPDAATYTCVLKAIAIIRAIDKGKQIHDKIARQGLLLNNIVLGSALVDMYAKCGAVSRARQVLDSLPSRNAISWNAMISGYAQEGHAKKALECFEKMQHEDILPDAVTYVCILKACATIRAVERGKQIHDEIARQRLLQNNIVLGGALVDMYAKCGAVSEARQVLDRLPFRDVVAWSALIAGYTQEGHDKQALDCLEKMQCEGIRPNAVTYTCILRACARVGAADKGKQIHEEIVSQGLLENHIVLGGAVVDMYAKCGAVARAQEVLDVLPFRDVVSWNALIAGYAHSGLAEQALECFEKMQCEGILPNAVTCACVLNVCNHRGLVEEGEALFLNMSTKYGVSPSVDCYTCMVDLFGRAGHIDKAVRLIQGMPSSEYAIIWHTLLSACRKWADVNVGRQAFDQAVKLDKSNETAYVLMANIYATANMDQNAENIEAMRIRNRAWKKLGHSLQHDSSNVINAFVGGDT